jgi:hypothetical protein
MSFDTDKIKAIVIDEKPVNKEHIKLFLERAKNTISLCKPEIVYVRAEIEEDVKDIVKGNNLFPAYNFEVAMTKALNGAPTGFCKYSAYIKE